MADISKITLPDSSTYDIKDATVAAELAEARGSYDSLSDRLDNMGGGGISSITAGTGLTGGTISTSGTIGVNLKSSTQMSYNSQSTSTGSSSRIYPVGLDASGYLACYVPWYDTYGPSYSNLTPAEDGTSVSLVTTGDKYNWNNKLDSSNTTEIQQMFCDLGSSIPSNSDLNDYINPGVYRSQSASTSASLSNCPVSAAGFRLEVSALTTSTTWIMQRVYPTMSINGNPMFFERKKAGDTGWSPWVAYTPFTSDEKTKLSGIAAGAEVNVQSNWNTTDSTSDSYILNKPSIPSVSASRNYSSGTSIGSVTVDSTTTTFNVPTATTSSAGLMSASDKAAVDALSITTSTLTYVSNSYIASGKISNSRFIKVAPHFAILYIYINGVTLSTFSEVQILTLPQAISSLGVRHTIPPLNSASNAGLQVFISSSTPTAVKMSLKVANTASEIYTALIPLALA